MGTNLDDLSIEELENLLAEKRQQQKRFGARLTPKRSRVEQDAQLLAETLARHKPDVNLRRVGNRVLLAIEIFALLGLIVTALGVFFRLQELNRDAAQVQAQAQKIQVAETAAPVAQATLPASSQPPSSTTPDRFKGLVKQVVPVALPTPGPQAAVRIVIPALKVDALVVEGDDWEALKKGAGHHPGSANPGQRGNVVISAHNDVFGEIFRYIGELKAGDEVVVYSPESKFTYVVKSRRIVEPTDVGVLAPTTEPTLTLITCHPYLVDTQRMIVFAQLTK